MHTKICSKCQKEKDIEEFLLVHPARNKFLRRPDCRDCVRKRSRERYLKNPGYFKERMKIVNALASARAREIVTNYLSSHPCVDCGEKDIIVLDFDHVKEKSANVSTLVARNAREWRLIEEIEKCVVRCANCHRRKTARERRWYKVAGVAQVVERLSSKQQAVSSSLTIRSDASF